MIAHRGGLPRGARGPRLARAPRADRPLRAYLSESEALCWLVNLIMIASRLQTDCSPRGYTWGAAEWRHTSCSLATRADCPLTSPSEVEYQRWLINMIMIAS
mgnify:FL=1